MSNSPLSTLLSIFGNPNRAGRHVFVTKPFTDSVFGHLDWLKPLAPLVGDWDVATNIWPLCNAGLAWVSPWPPPLSLDE
jgi:hypothetical protein